MDNDSRNIAVASYITPAGWLVALLVRHFCEAGTPFAVFHLRQGLGLNLLLCIAWIVFKFYEFWVVEQIVYVLIIASAIYGIAGAVNERMLYQFPLGRVFEKIFKFVR